MGSVQHCAESSNQKQGMQAYAAPSLFQPHHARRAFHDAHDGKIPPILIVYYGISSIPACRFLAPMGFDAVWIDWEHTACGVETMTTMVHDTMFMSQGRTIPFVRVPGHDHAAIGYALDAGASIVIPQVDTVEQCKHVLSASKFGTKQNGSRSAPPFRLIPGLTDTPSAGSNIHESLNQQAAVMIQIESLEGINNLDAMLTECPGVDAVWLGTLDARISMNLPGNYGMGGDEKEWKDAVATFEATMKKHNKPRAGFGMSPDAIRKTAETYAMIGYDADVAKLASMAQGLHDARKIVSEVKRV
ncbi:Uu.00g131080.m01.CDS01 [Anthostomella pinea]|uniref:Uu.00g131080.m01.CDS01 n=1 Tax=Anthostomella pinea TaxID=933095 RepID=A0AAI8YI81_9PEZI|nr:Uu.00g131080.m01.CDS01 [Anthostomella pinea]